MQELFKKNEGNHYDTLGINRKNLVKNEGENKKLINAAYLIKLETLKKSIGSYEEQLKSLAEAPKPAIQVDSKVNDTTKNTETTDSISDKIKKIKENIELLNTAYGVLYDTGKREKYNEQLKEGREKTIFQRVVEKLKEINADSFKSTIEKILEASGKMFAFKATPDKTKLDNNQTEELIKQIEDRAKNTDSNKIVDLSTATKVPVVAANTTKRTTFATQIEGQIAAKQQQPITNSKSTPKSTEQPSVKSNFLQKLLSMMLKQLKPTIGSAVKKKKRPDSENGFLGVQDINIENNGHNSNGPKTSASLADSKNSIKSRSLVTTAQDTLTRVERGLQNEMQQQSSTTSTKPMIFSQFTKSKSTNSLVSGIKAAATTVNSTDSSELPVGSSPQAKKKQP